MKNVKNNKTVSLKETITIPNGQIFYFGHTGVVQELNKKEYKFYPHGSKECIILSKKIIFEFVSEKS